VLDDLCGSIERDPRSADARAHDRRNTMVRMATRLQAVLADPDGITFHGVARAEVLSLA
jgi:hypothetical protein